MKPTEDDVLKAVEAFVNEPERMREAFKAMGVDRRTLFRAHDRLLADAARAHQRLVETQERLDQLRYRPLWGGGRTPAAALETKYALVSALQASFPEKGSSGWYEIANDFLGAEVYAVTAEIQGLIEAASDQLPEESALEESELPSPSGIICGVRQFFGGSTDVIGWQGYGPIDSADPTERSWNFGGVALIEYRNAEMPWGLTSWPTGQRVADASKNDTTYDDPLDAIRARRFFAAFCYFVKQRVLIATHERADRAARKRAAALHRDPDEGVQVIQLRASRHEDGVVAELDSEWSVRWMVRGHWRQQPYGPNRSLVHPIWIAPYVKGPDGLPLKVSTRLFKVAR